MDAKKLIIALDTLPPDFPLVPINGNKQPLGYQWQHHPFTPAQMRQGIKQGVLRVRNFKGRLITVYLPETHTLPGKNEIGGFGVLTGLPVTVNGQTFYLMALDLDGSSAVVQLRSLSGGVKLPKTVAFSSGRPGRCQYLFLIPPELACDTRTRKIATGFNEQLEFRFRGLQSVLPPSFHPMTGKYKWRRSPSSTQIALAPDWIVSVMQRRPQTTVIEEDAGTRGRGDAERLMHPQTCIRSEKRAGFETSTESAIQSLVFSRGSGSLLNTVSASPTPRVSASLNTPLRRNASTRLDAPRCSHSASTTRNSFEVTLALKLLQKISPTRADDYWDWIKTGTALKTVSEDLLTIWDKWSQLSSKYKPGECFYKWSTLQPGSVTIGTLYYFAELDQEKQRTPEQEAFMNAFDLEKNRVLTHE